jgi:hypothetical protein
MDQTILTSTIAIATIQVDAIPTIAMGTTMEMATIMVATIATAPEMEANRITTGVMQTVLALSLATMDTPLVNAEPYET